MAGLEDANLDRFFFRRANLNIQFSFDGANHNPFGTNCTSDKNILNVARIKYVQENYRKCLKATLIPYWPPEKSRENETGKNSKTWPVISRPKPVMTPPILMVDMPDFFSVFSMKRLDWGVNGIATILCGAIYIWDPRKPTSTKYTISLGVIGNCVKWHPSGKFFAVADKEKYLSIWDIKQKKRICNDQHRCFKRFCKITSIIWMNSRKLFTGCSCGAVFLRAHDLRVTKYVVQCSGEVINLKLSANKLYLSITTRTSVVVWNIRADKGIGEYPSTNGVPKITDWHPWHDNIIAIDGDNKIFISSINKVNPLGCIKPPYALSKLNFFGFNSKSGELLYCKVIYESPSNQDLTSYLIVYKNTQTIVDEILYNHGAIKGFLWDPTGTKFASISSDESLCIWNFFGSNTELEKKYRKVSQGKLTTNMFKTVNMLCSAVR